MAKLDPSKALARLLGKPAIVRMSSAERIVNTNRSLIRRAMREGHGLDAIARELSIHKMTLKRHLHKAGLFFRKPRTKRGVVIRPKKSAILRAKNATLANI